MFTDIVGYTSLMSRNEEEALEILRKSRFIQQRSIEAYNGIWLKEMGDGVLAKFNTARDAVLCGIEIQNKAHNDLDASIRIGIHLGDVTIENNDIFGDGVNVASRLQSSSDPGGIYISDSVFKAVQAIPDIKTIYLGEIAYKNVEYPVSTYAIQGSIFPFPQKNRLIRKGKRAKLGYKVLIPLIIFALVYIFYFRFYLPNSSSPIVESIAVLPFDNLTNNETKDVFIAGMHDALISELGRINPLRVISKTSTLRYKNSDLSIAEIANELDVDAVVETSVLQLDSLVNLRVKLIKVFPREESLWSNSITRDFTHILEIYRSVTHSIVDEIKVAILPESSARLGKTIIVNPEAYIRYLNGQYYLSSLSKESLDKAIEYFQASIKEDPDYAPAYGGIASVWAYRQQMGFASREEAVPEIETNLNLALSLDKGLAESYHVKAVVEAWTNWNWLEAEKAFQEALSINPNLAESHAFYSHLLMCLKRPIEMKLHMDQAIDLDPYNPLIQVLKGVELSMSGQSEEAIVHFEPLDKLAPNNPLVQIGMWMAYHVKGDYDKAYEKQKRILEIVSRDDIVVQIYEDTYKSSGYKEALKAAADSWTNRAGSAFVPPDNIYWLYGAAGDERKTLEWLKIGFEMHDSNMPYVAVLPVFNSIQDNPEYLALLEKLNLPKE
jgi:TolB-like protein